MTEEDKKVAWELIKPTQRIVPWAVHGEHIKVQCKKCGYVCSTKNISYIGARGIFDIYEYEQMNHKRCKEGCESFEPVEPKEWELA